jgi:alternate signal-mediated exported protein
MTGDVFWLRPDRRVRTLVRTDKENSMNKLLKGSIAGAAGVVLLLGGAGTLAAWNDSAALDASDVTAGTLDIATVGTATIAHASSGATVQRIVPGDTIVVNQAVDIDATGDNLRASLTVDVPNSLSGILDYPGVNLTASAIDASGDPVGPLTSLSGAQAASIDRVLLTATFPTSVSGTDGQNMTFDLSALALKLTQIS